jgi:hypothetical protein
MLLQLDIIMYLPIDAEVESELDDHTAVLSEMCACIDRRCLRRSRLADRKTMLNSPAMMTTLEPVCAHGGSTICMMIFAVAQVYTYQDGHVRALQHSMRKLGRLAA